MAAAFLPWEKWLARLVHPIKVALARKIYNRRRKRHLAKSAGWPQANGTVLRLNWDSSYPREEVVYFYSTERG